MALLTKYDAEMLLGQISYSQKADIYNYGYPVQPKSCSKLDKEELPVKVSHTTYQCVHVIAKLL